MTSRKKDFRVASLSISRLAFLSQANLSPWFFSRALLALHFCPSFSSLAFFAPAFSVALIILLETVHKYRRHLGVDGRRFAMARFRVQCTTSRSQWHWQLPLSRKVCRRSSQLVWRSALGVWRRKTRSCAVCLRSRLSAARQSFARTRPARWPPIRCPSAACVYMNRIPLRRFCDKVCDIVGDKVGGLFPCVVTD